MMTACRPGCDRMMTKDPVWGLAGVWGTVPVIVLIKESKSLCQERRELK